MEATCGAGPRPSGTASDSDKLAGAVADPVLLPMKAVTRRARNGRRWRQHGRIEPILPAGNVASPLMK
jgi:hypothetical protein